MQTDQNVFQYYKEWEKLVKGIWSHSKISCGLCVEVIIKPHAPQKNNFHATSPSLATDSPQHKRSNKFMYEEKHVIGMSWYNSYSIVTANWEV